MFKDLNLSMYGSIELVKISSTRSMLKTIGGCMSGMAVRCIPKAWTGSCKLSLSEESVKDGKVVRCVPKVFSELLEL